MTNPIKAQGYVQVGAWTTKRADNTAFANAGVTVGGNLKTANGFYLNGELGAGTAFKGQVKVGKDTHLGNGWGIDVSAKAEGNLQIMNKSLVELSLPKVKQDIKVKVDDGEEYSVTDISGNTYNGVGPANFELKYEFPEYLYENRGNSFEIKLAGRVESVKNFKAGKIKAGMEVGYQNDLSQETVRLERHIDANTVVNGVDISTNIHQKAELSPKSQAWYVTPTLSGELNLNNKGNLKLVADLSLTEARAGINWVF